MNKAIQYFALIFLFSVGRGNFVSAAPDSRFIIHGGDLVANADPYLQWSKWFKAAGWINGMVPSIPVPGNHDYYHGSVKKRYLTDYWRQLSIFQHIT